MSKRTACLALCAAMAACSGCSLGRELRAVSMEVETPQGRWRLEDIPSARLDLKDWEIRILESQVATATKVPYLEKLVVEVANTSAVSPLVLEGYGVSLAGLVEAVVLGPWEKVVLGQNESHIIRYSPGLRAEMLPYPYHLNVTAGRPGQGPPQSVKIVLY